MKRLLIFYLAFAMFFAMSAPVRADYDPETDYISLMIDAAAEGDIESGLAAEQSRAEKIEGMGLEYELISFMDLYLLGKIMYAEAGSVWLPDEWKMAVGEVVLNRVASPEFPDTIQEVLEQKGQYYGKNNSYFKKLKPSRLCVELALKLLTGERVLNEPKAVFQSNYVLGSGVFREFKDKKLGSTYICYTSYPEKYES